MKTSLTSGLDEQQKDEMEREFGASARLRERLIYILEGKMETNKKEVRSKENYQNPSWAYLQADGIGYERAISELISLLSSKNI
mgnify:FL=1